MEIDNESNEVPTSVGDTSSPASASVEIDNESTESPTPAPSSPAP
jgi:hypothetical protein